MQAKDRRVGWGGVGWRGVGWGGGGYYLCEVGCSSFLVQAGDVNVVEAGLHPEEGLVGHLSIQVGI